MNPSGLMLYDIYMYNFHATKQQLTKDYKIGNIFYSSTKVVIQTKNLKLADASIPSRQKQGQIGIILGSWLSFISRVGTSLLNAPGAPKLR